MRETWEVLKESPLWESLTPYQKVECLKEVAEQIAESGSASEPASFPAESSR